MLRDRACVLLASVLSAPCTQPGSHRYSDIELHEVERSKRPLVLAAAERNRGCRLGRESAGQAAGVYLFSDNKSTRRKGNKGKAVLTLRPFLAFLFLGAEPRPVRGI